MLGLSVSLGRFLEYQNKQKRIYCLSNFVYLFPEDEENAMDKREPRRRRRRGKREEEDEQGMTALKLSNIKCMAEYDKIILCKKNF